jgi:antitoxin VapB
MKAENKEEGRMTLNIKHPEADRMARELARRRGESITDAVLAALREQLKREQAKLRPAGVATALMEVGRRYASLPVIDRRSDDEILGYDERGLPR